MNKKIFIIGIVSLIIDQVSKVLIDTFLEPDQVIVIVKNFFYLTRVGNTGAAFSILEGYTLFLIALSFVCIILLFKLSKDFKKNKTTTFAFGLLVGGILGNLSDRLFLGIVRDFLKFKIFEYNFPIFNVADMCIVIGVILLIVSMYKGEEHGSKSRKYR